MEYSGAWGKLIHEKTKMKISCQTPFNNSVYTVGVMYDLVGFSYNLLVLQALCIFVIGLSCLLCLL